MPKFTASVNIRTAEGVQTYNVPSYRAEDRNHAYTELWFHFSGNKKLPSLDSESVKFIVIFDEDGNIATVMYFPQLLAKINEYAKEYKDDTVAYAVRYALYEILAPVPDKELMYLETKAEQIVKYHKQEFPSLVQLSNYIQSLTKETPEDDLSMLMYIQ